MIKFLNKKKELFSPTKGKVITLENVKDEMFSNKTLGDGFAVEFKGGEVVSPISGEVTMIFPTKHAFGIKNNDIEVLVHIGIDTVELNGEGFTAQVKPNDRVKHGDTLAIVDAKAIQERGYDLTIMVILTNQEKVQLIHEGIVEKNTAVANYIK